jgi:hypothetical protein
MKVRFGKKGKKRGGSHIQTRGEKDEKMFDRQRTGPHANKHTLGRPPALSIKAVSALVQVWFSLSTSSLSVQVQLFRKDDL